MDPNAAQQMDPNGSGPNSKQVLKGDALMHNMKQFELFHIVIYMSGGTIAGILGLTGLEGLYLLLIVAVLSCVALMLRMKMKSSDYTTMSALNLMVGGVTGQCMTFILFWTCAFALVHLY
jgi:hypothetical protein